MIRRPPRSTLDRSSAASDVYKRQAVHRLRRRLAVRRGRLLLGRFAAERESSDGDAGAVSYTHLRAHETVLDLVCRLLLETKKNKHNKKKTKTTQNETDTTIQDRSLTHDIKMQRLT